MNIWNIRNLSLSVNKYFPHPYIGGVIATEVIVHLTAADMHIDYDAALLTVQSPKARQYGDLVSRTKLFIKDAQQIYIASNS